MSLAPVDIKFFKMAVGVGNLGKITDSDISARCPVCGDSRKSKQKKRLHLYEKNGLTQVSCFNGDCPAHNKTVYSFLRDFYPQYLPQYKTETFSRNIDKLKSSSGTLGSLVTKQEEPKIEKPVQTQDLSPYMMHLKDSDDGVLYLRNRGIEYRPQRWGKWYFGTQDLKIGDVLYKIKDSVVIPLYWESEMYGFYSRSIKEKSFITYMSDANVGYKIWNWFKVDKSRPVYIFEGIFDAISSGKTNIIALLGAKLPEDRLKELKDPVFCLDADRTGLINAMEYAKRGFKVYIQPKTIKEKDFNEIMLNHPELNLSELIDQNIYSGVSAQIRIKALL